MDEEFIQPYKVCMVKLFGPESIYYHNREGLARSLMLMPPCQARVTIAQEMVTEGRVS